MTYEPGQAVWVRYKSKWAAGTVIAVNKFLDERWVTIPGRRSRQRILAPSDLRPRDPARNGDDKPKE